MGHLDKKNFYLVLLILSGMSLFSAALHSQSAPDSVSQKEFFRLLDSQIPAYASDSTFQPLILQVRGYCQGDKVCFYQTYDRIIQSLEEEHFNLIGAIAITKEALRELGTTGLPLERAALHYDLFRYYGALNLGRKGIFHFEESSRLFEEGGNRERVLWNKFALAENELAEGDTSAYSRLKVLLDRAKSTEMEGIVAKMYLRLSYVALDRRLYEDLELYTRALEAIVNEGPYTHLDYVYRMQIATGRGMLELHEREFEEALSYLHKASQLANDSSSIWLQIRTRQYIAAAERQRDSLDAAEFYLAQTDSLASELELYDLLVYNYSERALVAEADNRPADALYYTRQQQHFQDLFESRNNGFNLRAHQLEQENKARAAELADQETRLRRNRFFIGAFCVAIVFLLLAFLYQRRRLKRQAQQDLETATAVTHPETVSPTATPEMSVADRQWMEKFDHYLERELDNDLLSIGMISGEFAMSDSSLLRQVKRLTGKTPQRYLLHKRMKQAAKLLQSGRYRSISELARKVGYSDSKSFSRSFKRIYGTSPTEFINN